MDDISIKAEKIYHHANDYNIDKSTQIYEILKRNNTEMYKNLKDEIERFNRHNCDLITKYALCELEVSRARETIKNIEVYKKECEILKDDNIKLNNELSYLRESRKDDPHYCNQLEIVKKDKQTIEDLLKSSVSCFEDLCSNLLKQLQCKEAIYLTTNQNESLIDKAKSLENKSKLLQKIILDEIKNRTNANINNNANEKPKSLLDLHFEFTSHQSLFNNVKAEINDQEFERIRHPISEPSPPISTVSSNKSNKRFRDEDTYDENIEKRPRFDSDNSSRRNTENIHQFRKVTEIDKYRCGICEKLFFSTESLRMHKASHGNIYSCQFCPNKFPNNEILARHINRKHR